MTLPFIAATPFYWDEVECSALGSGMVSMTYTRPNANAGVIGVWQGVNEAETTGDLTWDVIVGSQGAFGESTLTLPDRVPISSSNPVAFMRMVVRPSSNLAATWPDFTVEKLATTPRLRLPSGYFEVLIYGTFSYGAANRRLPITVATAKPAVTVTAQKRVTLDGGAP